MPLDKSGSKESVGENIKAEQNAGKPHKQAVAIALSVQRKAGGGKPKPPSYDGFKHIIEREKSGK